MSRRTWLVPDILIPDFPGDALRRLDEQAAALGLSRNEYLRRTLLSHASRASTPVTVADLRRFAERFADLGDEQVASGAWS